jgi:hypothetical protein
MKKIIVRIESRIKNEYIHLVGEVRDFGYIFAMMAAFSTMIVVFLK